MDHEEGDEENLRREREEEARDLWEGANAQEFESITLKFDDARRHLFVRLTLWHNNFSFSLETLTFMHGI